MNTETNPTANSDSLQTPAVSRGKGLKVAVMILSLTALCLSYRAASEAVALYGLLDKVYATFASEQSLKTQSAAHVQIFETKPAVAGL